VHPHMSNKKKRRISWIKLS